MPVALEKTVWTSQIIAFLGMLLNMKAQTISVPEDKHQRAIDMLLEILYGKKATVLRIQQLTGLISYLSKAIYLGRSYVRCFCAKISNPKLKQHHHIRIDKEMRLDCLVWLKFLTDKKGNANHLLIFSRIHTQRKPLISFQMPVGLKTSDLACCVIRLGPTPFGNQGTSSRCSLVLNIWSCMC